MQVPLRGSADRRRSSSACNSEVSRLPSRVLRNRARRLRAGREILAEIFGEEHVTRNRDNRRIVITLCDSCREAKSIC